jgi:hypothetical protein
LKPQRPVRRSACGLHWRSIVLGTLYATLVVGLPATSALAAVPVTAADVADGASDTAQRLVRWVVASGDNAGVPFVIVDKAAANVWVFDAEGRSLGGTPALLGSASGDDSTPGIGSRPLSSIRSEERTTPAGRFTVSLGENLQGQEILWIDYEMALSLHRVVAGHPREQRARRLASAKPQDRRISYGCINVPIDFYDRVVSPTFTGTSGVAYILPETRALAYVFPALAFSPDERP